jgi:hypothetical protein
MRQPLETPAAIPNRQSSIANRKCHIDTHGITNLAKGAGKGKMGTKGNGLIIKDPHTLECAGEAQRRRRFFPLNSRKTARQRSGLRQPSGAFGVNKPQRNLPLVAQFPSFSHHHNLLVINASRARSCQIVVGIPTRPRFLHSTFFLPHFPKSAVC